MVVFSTKKGSLLDDVDFNLLIMDGEMQMAIDIFDITPRGLWIPLNLKFCADF